MSELFDFRSKAEKERDRKAHFAKCFPLGEVQKEKEEKLLSERFDSTKRLGNEAFFLSLTLKDALLDEDQDNDYLVWKWARTYLCKDYSDFELAYLYALANISLGLKSLRQFPGDQQIAEKAGEYEAWINEIRNMRKWKKK